MAIDRIRGSALLDSTVGTDDIANNAVTTAKLGNVTDIASSSGGMTLSPAGTEILNVGTTGDVIVKGQGSNRGMLVLRAGSNTANSQLRFGDQSTDEAGRIMYDHTNNFMRFDTDENESMRIDELGRVTSPRQPAFSATATTTNIPLTTQTTITLSSERFDVGGHLSGNTFTAPVTGKYQANVVVRLSYLSQGAAYYYLELNTSNDNYYNIFDPDFGQDNTFWTITFSSLIDMDAGDTAKVRVLQEASGTGGQTDIEDTSFFSIYLVA